ncbi:uncharacterized protein LOC100377232 isoform X1 [Saccoglossus kowalevskii]
MTEAISHAPQIRQNLPRDKTVSYGDDFSLVVRFAGAPEFVTWWEKPSNARVQIERPNSYTSVLRVYNASFSHSGDYQFIVSNDYGKKTSKRCSVQVQFL